MKSSRQRRALPVLAVLAACASACTTTVPVIPKLLSCEVAQAQLQEACTAPGTIGPDVTYNDVIGIAITDRSNLRLCAQKYDFLAKAISACNAAIAEHNKRLEDINAQLSKR